MSRKQNIKEGTLGSRINEQRKAMNMTQDILADAVGSTRQRIGDWEQNKATPDIETLKRLCKALYCDCGYLLGEYEEKTRPVTDIKAETGLSPEAIEMLQALKEHNLDGVLHLISEAITYTLNNPLYSENETILFQALSNTLHLMKLGVAGEMAEKGYLWLLQDMFMEFIKHQLKENKSAPALIAPRQIEKKWEV